MRLLGLLIHEIRRPARNRRKGAAGEARVRCVLRADAFGDVDRKQVQDIIIEDTKGNSHQIDHIEIRHNGIFCIEVKNLAGKIYGDEAGDYWIQDIRGVKNKFRNPLKQNSSHVRQLEQILNQQYPVHSVVVLVKNNAAGVHAYNVVNLNNLRAYLEEFDAGVYYSMDEMERIRNTIEASRSALTNQEHIRMIQRKKASIRRGFCPFCGAKLEQFEDEKGVNLRCSDHANCSFVYKTM